MELIFVVDVLKVLVLVVDVVVVCNNHKSHLDKKFLNEGSKFEIIVVVVCSILTLL